MRGGMKYGTTAKTGVVAGSEYAIVEPEGM